jgi:hypothetical protein
MKFLPELKLTYGEAKVTIQDLRLSQTFASLVSQPGILADAVHKYLGPFLDEHPFREAFDFTHLPAFDICSQLFVSDDIRTIGSRWRNGTLWSMRAPDASKLWIERVGEQHVRINFDFLDLIW